MILEQANPLAVVEGVLSRFLQATAAANAVRHVCQACSEIQSEKGQRVACKPSGERELGIVQEDRTWRPIPMGADLLYRSLRGSEVEPTTSSRYSSFRDCERSLDPGRLGRAFRNSWTNGVSPIDFWVWLEARKSPTCLLSPHHVLEKNWPKWTSLSASQWLSRCGILRPPLLVRWMQICLRTIGLWPPQSNLVRDCCSASRRSLGRESTGNL